MMRWKVVLAWMLTAVGCRQPPSIPPTNYSGYRLLADGTYHSATVPPLHGFYVLGSIPEPTMFHPVGDVQGEGELVEAGTSGWMELVDGSFHPSSPTSPPPEPPFVAGVMSQDGVFSPSTRRVTR